MKKFVRKMIELLVRMSSVETDPSQRKENEKIARKFNLWVAEKKFCNPDEGLSDLAEEFGITEEELTTFFTVVMDSRFSSVRKRLRLEEARRLINENPYMKIVQVANHVGIKDKCNFRKQFREAFGIPPAEWQRECLKAKSEK